MSGHEHDSHEHVAPLQHLNALSVFSAKSFLSTDALIEAILRLITEQVGLRTSFLTHITLAEKRNHVLAVYNQPDGCNLAADTETPLEDTF